MSSLGDCPAALERTWAVALSPSTLISPTDSRGSRTSSKPFSSASLHGSPICSTVAISFGARIRRHSAS